MASLLSTSTAPIVTANMQQIQEQPTESFTAPVQATKSMWSIDAFTDASARHEFIAVGNTNRNRVTIQDAYDLWAENPNILFQTGYRIVGTREDIIADLTAAQMTQEQIEDVLQSAISSENYLTDMATLFHDAMKEYITWSRTAVKTNAAAPGNTLFNTMASMNPSLLAGANKMRVPSANTGGNPGGPGRKVEPILQKLQKLQVGYYLDVSNMDDYGRKTKPIAADKLAGRVYTDNIRIVSNKLDRYIAAINMIPGGNVTYANDIQYVTGLLSGQANTGYYPQAGALPAQQPQQPRQMFTPGFQPLAPQLNGTVVPQAVRSVMSPKQRKQKAAQVAQGALPGYTQQSPMFSNALVGNGVTGTPVNFSNVVMPDDEYYNDDDEDADEYYDGPMQQAQPPQPPQQYQAVARFPVPQAPRVNNFVAPPMPQAPIQPRYNTVQTPQVPQVPVAPLVPRPAGFPMVQQRSPPVPIAPVPIMGQRSPQVPPVPQQAQQAQQ